MTFGDVGNGKLARGGGEGFWLPSLLIKGELEGVGDFGLNDLNVMLISIQRKSDIMALTLTMSS